MSKQSKFWLMVLVLLAAALRFHGLFANSFHADEALFASWSRLIAVWRDPLLQSQVVDKPPLLFYLQALFFPLFGAVEWAARMPNFIASLLLIPISGLLVWKLFRDEMTVVLVAAFVAFSPLAIQFSTTAFIDPLLTFLLATVLAMVASHRHIIDATTEVKTEEFHQTADRSQPLIFLTGLLAGIVFGLAVMTKYQTWLFLPLVIGLGVFNGWRWHEWRSWLLGLLPFVMLLGIWDLLQDGHLSLVGRQLSSFGGLRFSWSWELWPRLEAWGRQWSYLLDSPVLVFAIILTLPLFLALLIDEHKRLTAVDLLFLVFLVSYFVFHWFLAIPVWDRYVLPVLPIVGIILGRYVWRTVNFIIPALPPRPAQWFFSQQVIWLVPLILLILQAPSILKAYRGDLPIGGQPSADSGASQIAAELHQLSYGTVLYDHWYSWQWQYHLFDQHVYVNWFPSPEELVEDLVVFGRTGGQRFIVLPNSGEAEIVKREIVEVGFDLSPVKTATLPDNNPGMTLYQIITR